MHATVNSAHGKNYFSSSLQPTQYFLNAQEMQGNYYGLASDRLGLTGLTDRDTFFALCENKHPLTGRNLTPRNKDNRTVFYDISYHCPKSVSLLFCLGGDKNILDAFQDSVRETMREMERDMLTRVRKKGKDEDRQAGEMIIGEFIHLTARPSKCGISDPHLHIHNAVQNVTWDSSEGRYKAGNFREIARSLPYYQQRYHKRFADKLMALGYKIRKTRSAFEIEGIDPDMLELFSKRTSEIGQFAKDHGITDAKQLDQLGQRTRGKKQKDMSMTELKAEWRRQIREASVGKEGTGDVIIRHKEKISSPALVPQTCVDYAAKHIFERLSTVNDRRLLENAYRYSVGNNSVTLEDIDNAFKKDSKFIFFKDGFQNICTTKEVLAEEKEMVTLARNGQNRFKPLYSELPKINLEGQQKNAVEHILTTTNTISIVRGAAGAGKTTMLIELEKHLKAIGKQALYATPTADAVYGVLKKEGFDNSQTVARVIIDKEMQNNLENQILVIDEAGLIGVENMRDILALATSKNARLLLLGDPMQHSSVSRGDSLRILSDIGKIKPAEINKIRRQRNEKYREAVQDLANGKINAAFGKLENIDAIRQIDPLNPNAELVADYINKTKQKKSVLIISPTHQQGQSLTADLRNELKDAGLLGNKEIAALKLNNLNLTEAQKGDWRNYRKGQTVQFDLPAPQIKRASVWQIKDATENGITLSDKTGQEKLLPLEKCKAYSVYEPTKIGIAKGDKVKITKNGSDKQQKRLDNGQLFDVLSINKAGEIKCRNKESKTTYILNSDYGHIDHAYCSTSHSTQGKTCDEILISLPASVFPATDSKLVYVAVSRGRDMATIYTDDKEQLLQYAERSGDRMSALELLAKTKTRQPYSPQVIRNMSADKNEKANEPKTVNKQKHLSYEP